MNKLGKVKYIVVHCSATKEGHDFKAEDIKKWHQAQGWATIGYHFVVDLDGSVEIGRPTEYQGAHVAGHNHDSLAVCYIGGLDANGNPKDTRTPRQKQSLRSLVSVLAKICKGAKIVGHRDLSKDLDGNGVIEPREWVKECPCFDAAKEYEVECR